MFFRNFFRFKQQEPTQSPPSGYKDLRLNKSTGNLVLIDSSGAEEVFATSADTAGTTTNDDAAVGQIGEFISSKSTGSGTALTTTENATIASISLTAGDWDVEGFLNFQESSASATQRSAGISLVDATLPTDDTTFYNTRETSETTQILPLVFPRKRISIAATTTVYLVGNAYFSAGTVNGFGELTARRAR